MKKLLTVLLSSILMIAACFGATACSNDPDENAKWAFGSDWLPCESQLNTLTRLDSGDIDVAIIDSVMANYYANEGGYADTIAIIDDLILAQEEYGIAGRKQDKALVSKINEALIAVADNQYSTLIESYGMQASAALSSSATNPLSTANDNSWNDIVNAVSPTINIGYTEFAPICYNIQGGVPTKGFDVDLANAVVEYLENTYNTSISITWVEIDWNAKETLLENGTIDLIWNGMTITPQRAAEMCVSIPYLYNRQVAVIRKADANVYRSFMDLKDAIIGFEDGSAGQSVVEK